MTETAPPDNGLAAPRPLGDRPRSDVIDTGALITALWRGRWLIALITSLSLSAGAYYAFLAATPMYRATSVLILETRRESVVDLQTVIGGLTGDATEINSEVEVLRSRGLIGRVVDHLHLDSDAEFAGASDDAASGWPGLRRLAAAGWPHGQLRTPGPDRSRRDAAISVVLDRVKVRNVPLSLVFKVTAESTDPVKAALIADTVARLYIQGQVEAKHAATEQAKTWLHGQAAELKSELERAEAAVGEFSANTDLVSAEALQTLERRLKELRERVGKADLAVQEATNKHRALEAAQSGQDKVTLAGDPELHRLLIRAGPGGAKSAAFETRLTQVLARAGAEVARAEQQLATLRRSEAELKTQLDRQGDDLITLQQLTREAEATRALYEYFLTRFKETAAQQGLQRPDSRILSDAVVPPRPSWPRKPLVLALSALFGLAAAIALVLLRDTGGRRFCSVREIEEQTGVPVLAGIPRPRRGFLPPSRRRRGDPAAADVALDLSLSVLSPVTGVPPGVILSTPASPGDFSMTTSVALAGGLTRLGHTVLLIDCGFGTAKSSLRPGLTASPGLAGVLTNNSGLDDAIVRPGDSKAEFLPAGSGTSACADLFSPRRYRDLFAELGQRYDTIILDAPSALVAAPARITAPLADLVLMTLCLETTGRTDVVDTLRLVHAGNGRAAAVVLSLSPAHRPRQFRSSACSPGPAYGDLRLPAAP